MTRLVFIIVQKQLFQFPLVTLRSSLKKLINRICMQKMKFLVAVFLFVDIMAYSQVSKKSDNFYELSILYYLKNSKYQGDSLYVESLKNVTGSLPTQINGIRVLVVTKEDLKEIFHAKNSIRILQFEYPIFSKDFISIKLGVYNLSMVGEKYLYGKVECSLLKIFLSCLSDDIKMESELTDQ